MRCARRTQVKIGVDIGKPLPVGLRVRNVDRAGDDVHVPTNDLEVAHQLDASRIPDADWHDVGLLEIPVDPSEDRRQTAGRGHSSGIPALRRPAAADVQ